MKPAPPTATGDPQNPWLGLVSFTEETRGYFHGREEEAAELGRRVQRKLLTVLFGQSGLGKTSILQAGLVPRLRPDGFCPVYVRLDYDPYSPPPAEQIKRALFRETAAAGTWTQSGSAVEGDTLVLQGDQRDRRRDPVQGRGVTRDQGRLPGAKRELDCGRVRGGRLRQPGTGADAKRDRDGHGQ